MNQHLGLLQISVIILGYFKRSWLQFFLQKLPKYLVTLCIILEIVIISIKRHWLRSGQRLEKMGYILLHFLVTLYQRGKKLAA